MDRVSQKLAGADFVFLTSIQQQKVLSSLEAGIEGEPAAREFFGLILEHTSRATTAILSTAQIETARAGR